MCFMKNLFVLAYFCLRIKEQKAYVNFFPSNLKLFFRQNKCNLSLIFIKFQYKIETLT